MSVSRDLWLCIALLAMGCAAYANALAHPFVHDDIVFIVQNPSINRIDDLAAVFLKPAHAPAVGMNAYYRPVLEVIYRLEYRLFGFNPAGFHAFNVILHTANGALLFLLLSRLGFGRALAWVIAAFFVVHPVQSEAVSCIAGISNIAAGFFVLLCLNCYMARRYAWALGMFVLALFTKESTVILPAVLIMLEHLYAVDSWRRKAARAGAFVAAALVFLSLRQVLTGAHLAADILVSPGELYLRILAIPRTLLMDMRMVIWPNDLHYYRNTDILAANAWAFIVLGLVAGILIGFFKKCPKEDRSKILAGAGWFVLFLLPVLNILPLINEYSFILTAEHFLYLPIVGIFIIVAVIFARLAINAKVRMGIVATLLAACMAVTMVQNTFWRGEIPLFERMVSFEPHFGRGHILLANAYFADRQYGRAADEYGIALAIMKGYAAKAQNPIARNFYLHFIQDIEANLRQIADMAKPFKL